MIPKPHLGLGLLVVVILALDLHLLAHVLAGLALVPLLDPLLGLLCQCLLLGGGGRLDLAALVHPVGRQRVGLLVQVGQDLLDAVVLADQAQRRLQGTEKDEQTNGLCLPQPCKGLSSMNRLAVCLASQTQCSLSILYIYL